MDLPPSFTKIHLQNHRSTNLTYPNGHLTDQRPRGTEPLLRFGFRLERESFGQPWRLDHGGGERLGGAAKLQPWRPSWVSVSERERERVWGERMRLREKEVELEEISHGGPS